MADESTYTEAPRSLRFQQWMAVTVFSAITLGATLEAAPTSNRDVGQQFAIWTPVVSLVLAGIVTLMHMISFCSIFVSGTMIEGSIILVLTILWGAAIGVITDVNNDLAVNESGSVENGNLYYFSWAAVVTSGTLLISFLQTAFSIDVAGELRARSARITLWSAFMMVCIIVMGTSADLFRNNCTTNDDNSAPIEDGSYCVRSKLAISIGTIGTIISLIVIGMKTLNKNLPFMIEFGFSICLFVVYAFGVAFITSEYGPGAPLGNLYYSCWTSFILSFLIVSSCVEDYQEGKTGAVSNPEQHSFPPPTGEIQIEDL